MDDRTEALKSIERALESAVHWIGSATQLCAYAPADVLAPELAFCFEKVGVAQAELWRFAQDHEARKAVRDVRDIAQIVLEMALARAPVAG